MSIVFAFPSFYSEMILALKPPHVPALDERLTNVNPEHAPWLTEQVGGQWGRYGWSLLPGEKGLLRIALPGSQAGIVKMRVWAFSPGRFSAQVSDGQKIYEIPVGSWGGQIITIPVKGRSELIVRTANTISEQQLVLDRLSVAWYRSSDQLSSLWPFVLSGMLIMVGWGGILWQEKDPVKYRRWIGTSLILTFTIIGADQRWTLLEASRSLPMDPDGVKNLTYAQKLDWFTSDHGFYSGNFNEREPMHVALLHLWMKVWGETLPAIRWYTVFLSISLITATGAFVWGISKQWSLGAIASGIMALNQALIDESVRGLRVESFCLFLLAVLSLWLWARGWIGAVLLGIVTGWMALLRAPTLSVMLPVIWAGWMLNWWQGRKGLIPLKPHQWKFSHLVITSCLAVSLFIPHLYGLYKVNGDPSWPSYGYARWNANFEFPERLGTPGFPSSEEFADNPYAGPQITYWDYLFNMHSIPTLVRGQFKGWVESTGYMSISATPHLKKFIILYHANGIHAVLRHVTFLTVAVSSLLVVCTALGWLQLWRHHLYWWIPFLSLWGTWYAAYLYNVRLIEPFRHTGHVYPLLLFSTVWGGHWLYMRVKNQWL